MVHRLFVCYSHIDKQNVNQLVDTMRAGGYEPWYDEMLQAGQDWKFQLSKAIEQSDALIYAMTAESLNSEWCQWEINQAIRFSKPIIPVRFRANLNISGIFSHIQFVDFAEGPTPKAVAKLMFALQNATALTLQEMPDAPENPQGIPVQAQISVEQAVAEEQTSPDERISQLKDIIDSIFSIHNIEPFFSNWRKTATVLFGERWNEIFSSKICLFDVSIHNPDVLIEFGIALAMNKPILVLAHQDTRVPEFVEGRRLVQYRSYNDLTEQIRAFIKKDDFSDSSAITDYCHFCNELSCKSYGTLVDPKKYLVISDSRLPWRPLLKKIEQQIVTQNAVFPEYSQDTGRKLCDIRAAVRRSQFFVSHIDYVSQDSNLIALGIALGNATPWFLIAQQAGTIPSILQLLDIYEADSDSTRADILIDKLSSFLKIVYPPLITDIFTSQTMPIAGEWQNLDNLKKRVPGRNAVFSDPILGGIEILRYNGSEIEGTYRLNPKTRNLVFGRMLEKGMVSLRSPDASAAHFRIYASNDNYYLEDLGSKNGTFLNGQRIQPNVPVEIYFGNTVTAGGSNFLIWDERPRQSISQVTGSTQPLNSRVIPVVLDIDLPPDLKTLHQEMILHVIYTSNQSLEERCSIEVQAYYPIGEILGVLTRVLHLPKVKHKFIFERMILDENETPLSLGLKQDATLTLEPDRVEWTMVKLRELILECEQDTLRKTDENTHVMRTVWKDEFTYVTLEELFTAVYKNLYNTVPEGNVSIPITRCPRCDRPLNADSKVTIAKIVKK